MSQKLETTIAVIGIDIGKKGNSQTVEVRHVHIHSGGQGVVGIVNSGGREGGAPE